MAADSKDWSSNANDALQIRLKHQDKSRDVNFKPNFTYPIFGDEESIFGYRNLKIRLDYTADTLKPSLSISFQHKYETVGETKPDDIRGTLKDFLPSLPSESQLDQPSSSLPPTPDDWEPPGELMHQYEAGKRSYGIWSATLTDERAKDLLRDVQILVLFFIEGGTCIELDDPDWTMDRWRVFFVYAIDPLPNNPHKSSYSFVGYSTAYTLFFLDQSSLVSSDTATSTNELPAMDNQALQRNLPCRSRISQFLILPPHQKSGHGAHLYNTIMAYFLAQPSTHEITVEDPNESFDDLRDFSDLNRLRSADPDFASLSLNTDIKLGASKSEQLPTGDLLPPSDLSDIRTRAKIAPRQFARLVEMQLLSRIPARNRTVARITRKDKASDANDRAYYFWRLLVKQRIYKQNADQLAQLDLDERVEKLEETLVGLEQDYLRILDGADRRASKIAAAIAALEDSDIPASRKNGVPRVPSGQARLKRRRVIQEDEEDAEDAEADDDSDGDDESSEVNANGRSSSKRRKVLPER